MKFTLTFEDQNGETSQVIVAKIRDSNNYAALHLKHGSVRQTVITSEETFALHKALENFMETLNGNPK